MSSWSEIVVQVEARAASRCEYCRMHQALQGGTLHFTLSTSRRVFAAGPQPWKTSPGLARNATFVNRTESTRSIPRVVRWFLFSTPAKTDGQNIFDGRNTTWLGRHQPEEPPLRCSTSITLDACSFAKPRRSSECFLPRMISEVFRDCSIATGADSKIARQEQRESTWGPLNASELAPNSVNGLIPSLIAWAKSQPPGNVAIVSVFLEDGGAGYPWPEKLGPQLV
jgi:hypothetical protein